MKTALKGVIHGKLIKLEQESGLPDGQTVSVTLESLPAPPPTPSAGRAGILASCGRCLVG